MNHDYKYEHLREEDRNSLIPAIKRYPIGIEATLRELERRNSPEEVPLAKAWEEYHAPEEEESEEDSPALALLAEVCRGYHVSSRDPNYDPPGHKWDLDRRGEEMVCTRCGKVMGE